MPLLEGLLHLLGVQDLAAVALKLLADGLPAFLFLLAFLSHFLNLPLYILFIPDTAVHIKPYTIKST